MLVVLAFLTLAATPASAEECNKRDFGNGGDVCVCDSVYCDTVPPPLKVEQPNILIYVSNRAGLRFHKTEQTFTKTRTRHDNEIVINPEEKYQSIIGWGGAFTDATGVNIKSLSDEAQGKLLQSYFADDGIEYSLCRVPIGGTDFSERAYSYDDGHEDINLDNFQLALEDFQYKIPYIKKAQALSHGKLRLFASAWTAPKWMKTNKEYAGFGFLKEAMYESWANYHVKFLDKYQERGIRFWGITTGNEPSLGIIPFTKINSVGWTPNMMTNWIRGHLGPTVRKSNHSDVKIIALDDQRFFLPWFINIMFQYKSTRDYVDGIGVHWYYDAVFPASLLTATHDNYPDKFILATEACRGDKIGEKDVILGSWQRGEEYADDIIEDVLNWVSGWVDWNMVLDLKGGPTYINNFVDSPIIVNASAGEFYKQPMYYCLGHFSKFVPRDSVRIKSSSFDERIAVAAFRRPDNGTTVVILNKKDEDVVASLVDDSKGTTLIKLSTKSITTILYW